MAISASSVDCYAASVKAIQHTPAQRHFGLVPMYQNACQQHREMLPAPSRFGGGEAMGPLRILIVDDHELVRRGLRSILLARPEWQICGEAVDGRNAIEKARELKPDVVLLDITMPHVNGLDAARVIRRDVPGAKVIILSQYDGSDLRARAFEAGAQGYVSKSDASSQLLIAIDSLIGNQKSNVA